MKKDYRSYYLIRRLFVSDHWKTSGIPVKGTEQWSWYSRVWPSWALFCLQRNITTREDITSRSWGTRSTGSIPFINGQTCLPLLAWWNLRSEYNFFILSYIYLAAKVKICFLLFDSSCASALLTVLCIVFRIVYALKALSSPFIFLYMVWKLAPGWFSSWAVSVGCVVRCAQSV